jgi:hypothetical protein
MTYILFNIKNDLLEIIEEREVLDKLYYLEYRPINNDDIKNYNKKDKIVEIIKEPNIVNDMKKRISQIEDKVPLYDPYSNNIFLINNYNVYRRVINQYYRFPEQELLVQLKDKEKDIKDIKRKLNILEERDLNKMKLMIQFMSYFDLDILYETYMKVFYKYSVPVGKEITTCPRPSFLPQFFHLKPYFTRSEIINKSLNMGIDVKENIKYDDVKKLCQKIIENEMDYNMLLKHRKYMVGKKSVGMIQYYTLQGSYTMNQYLRNKTIYKYKNKFLENLIKPVWELIKDAPEFDKQYTVYRFVKRDEYLSHLKIGETFIENGFMSTTRNPFTNSEELFGLILIKINVPKNVKGIALCLETISHFPEEQEILFPPLSKFKLIKKDSDCTFYHVDTKFSSKIKTRYEFDWVSNDDIKFIREEKHIKSTPIDFLKLERKINISLEEKIKYFKNNYVNDMGQFTININNNEYTILTEEFDSTGAYEKFYATKTKKGFSMYTIYEGYILFFLELSESEKGIDEMHINYYVKHSAIDPNKIIGDDKLIHLYSTIAYFFDIHNVIIYANYMNCEISYEDEDNKSKIFEGSYCVDFYQYFTTNKKRYSDINILNVELYPGFSYYELDFLKTISPEKIISKEDTEIYQVYHKIYSGINNNNIIDFYIWLKNYKCYLLDSYVLLVDKILGKNNPFTNDIYYLDPISYLYNRKYIKLYSSRFSILKDIKRNIIKKKPNEFNRD